MNPIFRTQLALAVGALALPATLWVLVLAHVVEPRLASDIAIPGLLVTWVGMLALPLVWRYRTTEAALTAFVLIWGFIGSFFPVIWDLTWAILHRVIEGATGEDRGLWYWWAYSVADTRFLRGDHLMVVVEYLSGILGFAEMIALWHFARGRLSTSLAISTPVSFMQFYGTIVFFGTAALNGFSDFAPDVMSRFKVFGLNGMWMVFPLAALAAGTALKRSGADVPGIIRTELTGRRR